MARADSEDDGSSASGATQMGRKHRFEAVVDAIRLPQNQIAKQTGVGPVYLSQVKTGTRYLTTSLAAKMQDAFGVSAAWLMSGEGRLVADPEKIKRDLDLGALPGKMLDSYDLYLLRRGVGGVEVVAGIPVLARLTDCRPNTSSDFAGEYVELPQPGSGELYCVMAIGDWCPPFHADEHVLIERRPASDWNPSELDGRICVVRRTTEGPLELCELQASDQPEAGEFSLIPLEGPGSASVAVRLDDIEVFGRVLFAFRPRIHVRGSYVRQTRLGGGANDEPHAAD